MPQRAPCPFSAVPLVQDSPDELLSLAVWSTSVIVGTSAGFLMLFAPPAGEPQATPQLKHRVQVQGGGVAQLVVAEACEALVGLLADAVENVSEGGGLDMGDVRI